MISTWSLDIDRSENQMKPSKSFEQRGVIEKIYRGEDEGEDIGESICIPTLHLRWDVYSPD